MCSRNYETLLLYSVTAAVPVTWPILRPEKFCSEVCYQAYTTCAPRREIEIVTRLHKTHEVVNFRPVLQSWPV
jgi:hypothetical protein